jgi:hypothetical protein
MDEKGQKQKLGRKTMDCSTGGGRVKGVRIEMRRMMVNLTVQKDKRK